MSHPLEFIPQDSRKLFFYFFLALTLILFGVFRQLDQPLQNAFASNGIVSFELARDVEAAQRMVDSWNADAKLAAAFGLGLDYLFMPVYALTLSLGLLLARGANPSRYTSFANLMGWGAFAAAAFDAVENYALWHTLIHGAALPYPQLAAVCASIKFAMLFIGILTALAGKWIQK